MTIDGCIRLSLEKALSEIANGRYAIKPPAELLKSVQRVRIRFGNGHAELIRKDRVQNAIRKIKSVGADGLNGREMYVLAYGLTQESDELGGASLLGSEKIVTPAIKRWSRDIQLGKLSGAVWRGLFNSFMQAPDGPGTKAVRQLLADSLPVIIERSKVKPAWLQTIQRHSGLLGDSPCLPYVNELTVGSRDQVDDLVSTMAPPASSWFWEALTNAVMVSIDSLDDILFESKIEFFLSIPQLPHMNTRHDQFLARILDRYEKTKSRSRHQALLDHALDTWGSPQLRASLKWSQVRLETKAMVCGWLALEDLEDFCRLCQGDRVVDERRLRYWLRFKEQIVFSQIALGGSLFYSQDPDMKSFRARKRGRLARLDRANDNNAILIQIGSWVFVEFSEIGNACYPYKVGHLPFEIGSTAYSVQSLKWPSAVAASGAERLTHRRDWEISFDDSLRQWGVYPDKGMDKGRRARIKPDLSTMQNVISNEAADQVNWGSYFAPLELRNVVTSTRSQVIDLRSKGGCLWVYPGEWTSELDRKLLAHGFRKKEGRGYFLA